MRGGIRVLRCSNVEVGKGGVGGEVSVVRWGSRGSEEVKRGEVDEGQKGKERA